MTKGILLPLRSTFKQMFRTPLKTLLFLLLLTLASAVLAVGMNLFGSVQKAQAEISSRYSTVGSIRQMPDSTKKVAFEFYGQTTLYDEPEYTRMIPPDAFEGLPVKLPVENRPTLYTSGKKSCGEALRTSASARFYIFTFTPAEDVDGSDEAFLQSHISAGSAFRFDAVLDMTNEKPAKGEKLSIQWPDEPGKTPSRLNAGKQYIAYGTVGYGGGDAIPLYLYPAPITRHGGESKRDVEYCDQTVYELTPEFWNTENGTIFSAIMENSQELQAALFPTVPTNSLSLLDPFYRGSVVLKHGREITPEEFASGARVCMIPESLATAPKNGDMGEPSELNNYLQVGDSIRFTWYGSAEGASPSLLFPEEGSVESSVFSAEPLGETESGEYEIVGIYYTPETGSEHEMGLGFNQAIIPSSSCDLSSVPSLSSNPISPGACSFELENGTAGQFMEAFQALGYKNLQATINDKGYSTAKKGLNAVSLVSFILLAAGGASVLCLLLFFVYLQIARSKREAAIQISLGAGKKRCAASLLLSVMLLAAAGAALGSTAGYAASGTLSTQVYSQARESGYSRDYSDQFESGMEEAYDLDTQANPFTALLCASCVAGAGFLLALGFTLSTLRKEPLELLAKKESE